MALTDESSRTNLTIAIRLLRFHLKYLEHEMHSLESYGFTKRQRTSFVNLLTGLNRAVQLKINAEGDIVTPIDDVNQLEMF